MIHKQKWRSGSNHHNSICNILLYTTYFGFYKKPSSGKYKTLAEIMYAHNTINFSPPRSYSNIVL